MNISHLLNVQGGWRFVIQIIQFIQVCKNVPNLLIILLHSTQYHFIE